MHFGYVPSAASNLCACFPQRQFADAFFCDPPRALGAQLLPAATPEDKAVVFLDYPNEQYKTEFLHL